MTLSKSRLPELHPGDALPGIVKLISQERINLYAEASSDFNPIHIDEAFAANTAFGGSVAHGMLILAYVSEMMTLAFGENWFSSGKLTVRFKAPARPKDTVTVRGAVDSTEVKDDNLNFICSINCSNQRQETIVTGTAMVKVKPTNQRTLEDVNR